MGHPVSAFVSSPWALAALALGLITSCGGSGPALQVPDGDLFAPSSVRFGDVHFGGQATSVHLTSLRYGRMVSVMGWNAQGVEVPMASDFVIRQGLGSDDLNYELTVNGVTAQEILLIRRNVEDPVELEEFRELLELAAENLDPIQVQGLETAGVYSMLPRNAALVLTFDDLLLPSTISDRTVEVLQGYPPTSPFEARVFPSSHYGGLASNGNFYPTRIIVDTTTTLVERQRTASGLPLNSTGLPASVETSQPNILIRVPTVSNASIGQTKVLTNLTNHPLATENNGPVDFSTNARPVLRALRSGSRVPLSADPFNGFLRDTTPPQLIGSTPLVVVEPPVQQVGPEGDSSSMDFVLPEVQLPSERCGRGELDGTEVIAQNGLFARVVRPEGLTGSASTAYLPDVQGRVFNLPVRLLTFPLEWDNGPSDWERFGAGNSRLESTFEVGDPAECFVQVFPSPAGFPNDPTVGVDPDAVFALRFSEAMDPSSLTAFDSVVLTRRAPGVGAELKTSDFVVGELNRSATLREATFVPILSLAHAQGQSESYYLSVSDAGSMFAPRDLAGNHAGSVPSIPLTLDAGAPSRLNGGRVSRFASTDEEAPDGPEWGGQIQIQLAEQAIRPRPVVRSTVVLDNSESSLMAQMAPVPGGVQTPFSPFGSKLQALWRYADCGFSLTDANSINIDVEGLSWSPPGSAVSPDIFEAFEIRLGHSRVAPDEFISPASLFPQFDRSGLKPTYTRNVLQGQAQQIVHPRERGYTIQPGDVVQTSSGTVLVPFPFNRGIPDADRRYFTWRDTRIRERAGPLGNGVEPLSYPPALGLDTAPNPYYSIDSVQTIGLPLLMEFRTTPQASAQGQNAWAFNSAVNSSSRPYFRAFSTGGVSSSGAVVRIDPENETMANGGFDPTSTPPGEATFGRDNSVHLGAIDYVTRISQCHSIWFEAVIDAEDGSSFGGRIYSDPTVEPAADAQPAGTDITYFYRGATGIEFAPDGFEGAMDNFSGMIPLTMALADYQYDAFTLDLYGDYYNDVDATVPPNPANPADQGHSVDHTEGGGRDNFGLTFLPGVDEEAWRESVAEITGARFYQIRLTFESNPVSGQTPSLSAFALTWTQE
jgi:hypothetical protein